MYRIIDLRKGVQKLLKLGEYIDKYTNILPSDTAVLPLASDDWYIAVKSQFNDLAWMYYYDREMLQGGRFPDDQEDIALENIKRCIAIYLIQNRRRYERLFNAFTADFNPLWNVDGVTGTISEGSKGGYDEQKKTGNDKYQKSGTETSTRTGSEEHSKEGTDTVETTYDSVNERNGTIDVEPIGEDYETTSATTFDDSTWRDTEKKTTSHSLGAKEETTYTNLADAKTGTDTEETTYDSTFTDTYNQVADTLSFNQREDKTTYDTTDKTTYNTNDKFIEMVIRQGNIGVTRSDELISKAIELFNSSLYDFYKTVVRDCVNQLTYRVY